MKNAGVYFVSGLALMLMLFSCGTRYTKEIAKVDSLQVVLGKIDTVFNTLDSARIGQIAKEIKLNLIFLQNNCSDTISEEMAEFLDEYNSVSETLELVNKRLSEMAIELKNSKKQLADLRSDLEHNILKAEQVKVDMEREAAATKGIQESIDVLLKVLKDNAALFEKDDSKVKELIEKIKNKSVK
jgi:hypothetical protein